MRAMWIGFLWLAGAGVLGAVCGCGSRSGFEFDALDLLPPQEELVEVSLGQYKIPIPVVEDRNVSLISYRHRFRLDFELFAMVSPRGRSQVADARGRHEGQIRDKVIRICRSASLDELQEPELTTLKARLMDALAAQIRGNEIRQLLITEVVSQPM